MKIRSLSIIRDSPVQAFQKLIYVSTLVFGEASSFLLPWKRVFKVTDSQVLLIAFDVVMSFSCFLLSSNLLFCHLNLSELYMYPMHMFLNVWCAFVLFANAPL